MPHEWIAFYSEYNYEWLDRDSKFTAGIEHLMTHRFPMGINFYHPSGFIAMVKAMHVDQNGTFLPEGSSTMSSGSDHFWVVDASLGYRLPKRLGLVTVGVKNLLNKSFRYQDIDRNNPSIEPKRFIFVKANFSL
jgi:outer membrane receptor protein involved in Fe transport